MKILCDYQKFNELIEILNGSKQSNSIMANSEFFKLSKYNKQSQNTLSKIFDKNLDEILKQFFSEIKDNRKFITSQNQKSINQIVDNNQPCIKIQYYIRDNQVDGLISLKELNSDHFKSRFDIDISSHIKCIARHYQSDLVYIDNLCQLSTKESNFENKQCKDQIRLHRVLDYQIKNLEISEYDYYVKADLISNKESLYKFINVPEKDKIKQQLNKQLFYNMEKNNISHDPQYSIDNSSEYEPIQEQNTFFIKHYINEMYLQDFKQFIENQNIDLISICLTQNQQCQFEDSDILFTKLAHIQLIQPNIRQELLKSCNTINRKLFFCQNLDFNQSQQIESLIQLIDEYELNYIFDEIDVQSSSMIVFCYLIEFDVFNYLAKYQDKSTEIKSNTIEIMKNNPLNQLPHKEYFNTQLKQTNRVKELKKYIFNNYIFNKKLIFKNKIKLIRIELIEKIIDQINFYYLIEQIKLKKGQQITQLYDLVYDLEKDLFDYSENFKKNLPTNNKYKKIGLPNDFIQFKELKLIQNIYDDDQLSSNHGQ